MTTYTQCGTIGEWTFYELTGHGFGGSGEEQPLYGYGDGSTISTGARAGQPECGEVYLTLDHALVAAVAKKHTGPGGAPVADWIMRMIGAGQLQEAGAEGGRALMEAVEANADGGPGMARRIELALEDQGFVIARQPK